MKNPVHEPKKITDFWRKMKTGLKKHQKTTEIWFHEGEPVIHVHTYNTDLRNRICAKASQYPDDFQITD